MNFSLEKLWAPIFFERLIDSDVLEDSQAEFNCRVTGNPVPLISWYL